MLILPKCCKQYTKVDWLFFYVLYLFRMWVIMAHYNFLSFVTQAIKSWVNFNVVSTNSKIWGNKPNKFWFLCEDCQRNSKMKKYLNHVSKIKYINSYYIFPFHSVDVLCVCICVWFIFFTVFISKFCFFHQNLFYILYLIFILYSMPPPLDPNIPSAAFLYSQCFLITFLHSKINWITNFHFLLQNFQLLESAQKYH